MKRRLIALATSALFALGLSFGTIPAAHAANGNSDESMVKGAASSGRDDFLYTGTATANGNLYHEWWNGSSWQTYQLDVSGTGYNPAVCSRLSGNIDMFVTNSGVLYHNSWDSVAGWSGWSSLGSQASNLRDVSCSSGGSGDVEVWFLSSTGEIYQVFWNSVSGWGSITDSGNGNSHYYEIASSSWTAGRYDLLVADSNSGETGGGHLAHYWWISGIGWNSEVNQVGVGNGISSCTRGSGNLEFFQNGTSGGSLAVSHDSYNSGSGWSGWGSLGADGNSGSQATSACGFDPTTSNMVADALGSSAGNTYEDYWDHTLGWAGWGFIF